MKLLPSYQYIQRDGSNYSKAILLLPKYDTANNTYSIPSYSSETLYTDSEVGQYTYFVIYLQNGITYNFSISKNDYYWNRARIYTYENISQVYEFYSQSWQSQSFGFSINNTQDRLLYLMFERKITSLTIAPQSTLTKTYEGKLLQIDKTKNYNLQHNFRLKKFDNLNVLGLTKRLSFPIQKCLCYFNFQKPSIQYDSSNYGYKYFIRSIINSNDYAYSCVSSSWYYESIYVIPSVHNAGFHNKCTYYPSIYEDFYGKIYGWVQQGIMFSNIPINYNFEQIAFSFYLYYTGSNTFSDIISYGFGEVSQDEILERFQSYFGGDYTYYYNDYKNSSSVRKDSNNLGKGIGVGMKDGKLSARIGSNNFYFNSVVNKNSWNHIILNYDGQYLTAYINGVKAIYESFGRQYDKIDVSNIVFSNATKIYIGSITDRIGNYTYINNIISSTISDAYIDQLSIFHTALTENEISLLYNNGNGCFL